MIDSLYHFLAGLGYAHPIHAPITHMPIGLTVGALIFFLVALIFARKNLILTARHTAILAFLFAFPVILFGVFDWMYFYKAVLFTQIKMKMILAAFLLVILALVIIFGGEVRMRPGAMLALYILGFLAVVGLGYYGGDIVFGGRTAAAPAATTPPAAGQQQAQAGGQAAAPSAAVSAGQPIFMNNCAACHADGGNVVAPDLPLKSSKKLGSLGAFTAFIRAPAMPDGSAGGMPAFAADTIDDKQAGDLYQYITSMVKTSWK